MPAMTMALRVPSPGGPEALRWEAIEVGPPGATELKVRHTFVGVNFIDIYHRTGLYPLESPQVPGYEGVGVVEAVGQAVKRFRPGDRIVYTGVTGAYAQARLLDERHAIALPNDIPDRTAAAVFVRGLTVDFLLSHVYPAKRGETVLIHAAAGGVGLLFCQWAAARGVRTLGVVSTAEKAALARENGCNEIIMAGEDLVEKVRALTGGAMLSVVYDSVGQATFDASLRCLRPFGLMVSFGNASGPVPPFAIGRLAGLGSLKVTRCTVNTATAIPSMYEGMAKSLFEMLRSGALRPHIHGVWPLREAAAAQEALASRATMGSLILEV